MQSLAIDAGACSGNTAWGLPLVTTKSSCVPVLVEIPQTSPSCGIVPLSRLRGAAAARIASPGVEESARSMIRRPLQKIAAEVGQTGRGRILWVGNGTAVGVGIGLCACEGAAIAKAKNGLSSHPLAPVSPSAEDQPINAIPK